MPVRHAIWKIGSRPVPLKESAMSDEAQLERLIIADPRILSERWLLIGQQVSTDHAGRIDLLAINQDAQLIVIELKRNRTPREVVAQALDYASWVQTLKPEKIARIFNQFTGKNLADEFERRYNIQLDEEQFDGTHQLVVVASELDPSSERIVNYLSGRNLPINVIFFKVFQEGKTRYLSRAWLIDPDETETKGIRPSGEWNNEFYVSFGHGNTRNWEEARKYGFISAGGALWYTKTLFLLKKGDRVWVNIPRKGYVGVGKVLDAPIRAAEFHVQLGNKRVPFLKVGKASYHREFLNDEDKSEYFVPIKWIDTRTIDGAVKEIGFFGNQNSVCAPTTSKWNHTVDRLKVIFNVTK